MDLFKNIFRQFRKNNSVTPTKHLTSNSDTDSLEKHSMANLVPKEIATKADDNELLNIDTSLRITIDNNLPNKTEFDKVINVEPTEHVNSNDLQNNLQEIDIKCTQFCKSEVTDNGSNKTVLYNNNCDDMFIEITDLTKLERDCRNSYNEGNEFNNNLEESTLKGLNEFKDVLNEVTNDNGSNENRHNVTRKQSINSFDELIDEVLEQMNQDTPNNGNKNVRDPFITNEDRTQLLPSVIKEVIVLDEGGQNVALHNNTVEYKVDNEPKIKQTDDNVVIISSDEETETIMKIDDEEHDNEMSLNSAQCFKNIEEYDSDCSGYHSSDFEFISESDAKLEGLINNVRRNIYDQPFKTVGIVRDDSSSVDNQNESQQNHIVPRGEEYLNLFRGIHNPVLPASAIHLFENKSVRSLSCMLVEFDGIGFEMQMLRRGAMEDGLGDEFKEDARECGKKILEMYPRENRKRRRRF